MQAAEHSGLDGASSTQSIDARLKTIRHVLESIDSLLDTLQSDLHPSEPAAPFTTSEPSVFSTRKPSSEWDD